MLVDGLNLLEGSSIANLGMATGTAFPLLPDKGEMFFRTDTALMHIYNGTAWTQIQTGSASSSLEQILKANFTGAVTAQTGTSRYYHPTAITITKIYASLGTAGGSITEVDVKINGSSIFSSTRPTIAAGQFVGSQVLTNANVASGSYITVDVLSAAGADLIVYIIYTGA